MLPAIMPMEKNATIFKKIKTAKPELPRKSVIDNLVNYSRSLQIIRNPFGNSFIFQNN